MKKVAIIADTTCDLSVELKEQYHIKTVPLHIHLGDKEYTDGVDISPDDIYRWSDENKATPKTSAVSPAEAVDALEAALAEAKATKGQPTVIIAKTTKGKDISFMENSVNWHGAAPNDEQHAQAIAELKTRFI